MSKRYKLKSTGLEVFKLGRLPNSNIPANCSTVVIPYNDVELRMSKHAMRGHVQVVNNNNLEVLK